MYQKPAEVRLGQFDPVREGLKINSEENINHSFIDRFYFAVSSFIESADVTAIRRGSRGLGSGTEDERGQENVHRLRTGGQYKFL